MALNLNLAKLAAKVPTPKPRVIDPHTEEAENVVADATHEADRLIAETDAIINKIPGGFVVENPTEANISDDDAKLSQLVDDDFPFDDSQLNAIYGLVQERYGCLIGAAGTGKTTTTKKLVDLLRSTTALVDVSRYWERGAPDEEDDYQVPKRLIPSIALVSFTGRATQMIKKNFPIDWHGNIMTIHRLLGFYPEFYQEFDAEKNEMVGKRRFVPAYDRDNLMPWDIIVIDEAGMLGLDLWHQLYAAMKPGCRIIMIGDINQLPPTHGKSILGFALSNWPTWELTHVHRQQGANNSIVDNAHRILKGLSPVSDSPTQLSLRTDQDMVNALTYMVRDKDWRFLTVTIDEEHLKSAPRVRKMLKLLQGKIYEPNRDVVITPVNAYEQTQPGYSLGQAPMNQALVTMLNHDSPRYFIDAGRERQNFAVGDKVMATANDYEVGITNGMTGIIESIVEHGAYIGDVRRYGLISEVNDYLSGLVDEEDDDVEFDLTAMAADSQAGIEEIKKREKRDAGPASHIVTVRFGEGEHSREIAFSTKSQVASLMLAYAATCHKMQGGECPLVFVIVHQAHKRPLNREWYYTAVTRASQRCVVLTTRQGQGFALSKQNIKGVTLQQKIKTFVALQQSGPLGSSVKVKLPKADRLVMETDYYEEGEAPFSESQAGDGPSEVNELAALPAVPESNSEVIAETPVAVAPRFSAEGVRDSHERPIAASIKIGTLNIFVNGANSESRERVAGAPVEGEFTEVGPESDSDRGHRDFPGRGAPRIEHAGRSEIGKPAQAESRPFHGKSEDELTHEAWVASHKVLPPEPKPVIVAPKNPLTIGQILALGRKK